MQAHALKAAGRLLRVLAEGDSWFHYPVGRAGSVIEQLQSMTGLPVANMAHYGDEVRQMLSLHEREEIAKRLEQSVNDKEPFDALLFSGGGNDIVGDQLCIWLKAYAQGMPADQVVDTGRFDAVLSIVEAGYQDLVEIRNHISPETTIFLHTYDFAVPSGKGVCRIGPWLEPSLKFRGVPKALQWDVVHEILVHFDQRIRILASNARDVMLVSTQGTLQPTDEWWANEPHPTDKGFKAIAQKFQAALKARFPRLPYA